MTRANFDPTPAAQRLAALWNSLERLASLPEAERPQDLVEGYAVQSRLADEIGEPLAGYKLGLSSAAAMARSGLGEPIIGFVPQSRLYRSGERIAMPPGGVLVEAEVAVLLPASGPAREAHLAFEMVRSRFVDRSGIDMPSFVADASGFHALVVGDAFGIDELPTLFAEGVTLWHDGRRVAEPLAGRERPDPVETLRRFAILTERHGLPTTPGMTIATGDLVAPYETEAKGAVEAQLGPYRVGVVFA